jgi:hypothetical protein
MYVILVLGVVEILFHAHAIVNAFIFHIHDPCISFHFIL